MPQQDAANEYPQCGYIMKPLTALSKALAENILNFFIFYFFFGGGGGGGGTTNWHFI